MALATSWDGAIRFGEVKEEMRAARPLRGTFPEADRPVPAQPPRRGTNRTALPTLSDPRTLWTAAYSTGGACPTGRSTSGLHTEGNLRRTFFQWQKPKAWPRL